MNLMAWTGRLFWLAQLLICGYGIYVARRPELNASTCAHPSVRTDGPETW